MNSKELKAKLEAAKADLKAYREKKIQGIVQSGSTDTKTAFAAVQKACGEWGVKSLDELLEVNTAEKRFAYMSAEKRHAVRELKEAVDVTLMIAQRFGKKPQDTKHYEDAVKPALKSLGINSGESGFEWIPTVVSSSYVEEYNLERKVAGLFQELKMPSNPYVFPVLSNGAIARKLGENAKLATADQFKTDQTITLTAVKISNQYELPEELNEDSAVDVMKVIREELIKGQEKAMEIAILEGDTASTHQHTNTQIPGASGVPASDSSERFFDGLRKRALAASLGVDCGGNSLNESYLSQGRQKLGKYGVNPAELAIIVGPKAYNEMMQLDDVRTLEQYGPQAPVLNGELAKYEGIPVIVSEWLREDTAASGVNASSGNTFLSLMLVNRKRFFTGLRRAIQIRVENFRTQFDVWDMVSYSRRAFQGVLKADGSNVATEKTVALLYHIA